MGGAEPDERGRQVTLLPWRGCARAAKTYYIRQGFDFWQAAPVCADVVCRVVLAHAHYLVEGVLQNPTLSGNAGSPRLARRQWAADSRQHESRLITRAHHWSSSTRCQRSDRSGSSVPAPEVLWWAQGGGRGPLRRAQAGRGLRLRLGLPVRFGLRLRLRLRRRRRL